MTRRSIFIIVFIVLIFLAGFTRSAAAQLTPIKISYATTSGIRLPLWIAEEARLYESMVWTPS